VFRAVRLESGPHQVRLVFWPKSFLVGLTISALTAAILLVASRIAARRRAVLSAPSA
jgi:hypothetical protein